jgi:hypothetical protein
MLGVEAGVQHSRDNHISGRAGKTIKIGDSHNISLISTVSSAAIIRKNPESFKGLAAGVARRLRRDRLGLLWVCLGSFWLWVALAGEKWGSDWLCLGSFGFAFGREKMAFFA